jgi:hypothetical protein
LPSSSLTIGIGQVDDGSAGEEKLGTFEPAELRGQRQRRFAAVVLKVRPGSLGEEEGQPTIVTITDDIMDRPVAARTVARIDDHRPRLAHEAGHFGPIAFLDRLQKIVAVRIALRGDRRGDRQRHCCRKAAAYELAHALFPMVST